MPVTDDKGVMRLGRDGDRVKPPTPQRRRRGWFVRDLVVVSIIAAILFALLAQGFAFMRTREIERRVLVQISEGATFDEIADVLTDAQLVCNLRRFSLAARFLDMDERLQAGAYEFGPRYSEL
ncbi:hypothetical protein K8S17_02245, partial [bacterium]|nr:hypothetical protein [bacterium]